MNISSDMSVRLWLLVPGKDTYIASCLWLQGWVPSCMKLYEYLPPQPPSRCLEGWSVKWLATRHGDPSPGADSGKGDRGRTYFLPGPAISVRCPSIVPVPLGPVPTFVILAAGTSPQGFCCTATWHQKRVYAWNGGMFNTKNMNAYWKMPMFCGWKRRENAEDRR